MDIIALATKLLNDNMGLSLDSAQVSAALSGLIGDGQGGIDLAGLATKMGQNSDMGELLVSWLGDGANGALSADSLTKIFGQADISKFAGQMGVDPDRKSTRLNSSHDQISYAVFCLKKKNKYQSNYTTSRSLGAHL